MHIFGSGENSGSLANGAPASDLSLVSVTVSYLKFNFDFVGHDCQEVESQVFFYQFLFKGSSLLVVIQAIILAYGEFMRTMKHTNVLTSLSDNGGIVTGESTTLDGLLECSDMTSTSESDSSSCTL